MEIIIHRGSREVGGSCVEVRSENSRIVLDIGMPLFDKNQNALDSFALRRMSKEELLSNGILPNVHGLFDDEKNPEAILLSHAHMDHTGLLDHSDPKIPVYASTGTSKMMLAGKIFANQVVLPRERFREIEPETPITIGDFKVTGFPVDHSIYGCLAYLIEADGKSILYTGDLRLHGRKPGMQKRLVEVFSENSLDALLMEGTHFGFPDGQASSEYDLENEIVSHVQEATGLVLASFSPQHVDRLVSFIRAAKKTNRQFVADVYTAFVMRLVSTEIKIPDPTKDDQVRVYFPESLLHSNKRNRIQKILDGYKRSRIEMKTILNSPADYLMVFRTSMRDDFENPFPAESTCLYSRWNGYLDHTEWKAFQAELKESKGKLIDVHTSGHMLSKDIVSFVKELNPKTVIPIHTFEPETFQEHFENTKLIEDGVSCNFTEL